jgi:hypothetical protein
MKTIFVFVYFVLLANAVAQQRTEPPPKGVIYGIAIGREKGSPRESDEVGILSGFLEGDEFGPKCSLPLILTLAGARSQRGRARDVAR